MVKGEMIAVCDVDCSGHQLGGPFVAGCGTSSAIILVFFGCMLSISWHLGEGG